MINYADFKNTLTVTKTDKSVTIPLFNETFDKSVENTLYVEVYSNVSCEKMLFQTENIATIPIDAKNIKLDLSFLNSISSDNIVIVVGVAGSFSTKYLLRVL